MIQISKSDIVSCPSCRERDIKGFTVRVGEANSSTILHLCEDCTGDLYNTLIEKYLLERDDDE